jgi:hypothetical protein
VFYADLRTQAGQAAESDVVVDRVAILPTKVDMIALLPRKESGQNPEFVTLKADVG